MKRALPVLAVLLLAPWVGEFLLGNISVRQLPALLILALLGRVRGAVDPGGDTPDIAARPRMRVVTEKPRSQLCRRQPP